MLQNDQRKVSSQWRSCGLACPEANPQLATPAPGNCSDIIVSLQLFLESCVCSLRQLEESCAAARSAEARDSSENRRNWRHLYWCSATSCEWEVLPSYGSSRGPYPSLHLVILLWNQGHPRDPNIRRLYSHILAPLCNFKSFCSCVVMCFCRGFHGV